VHQERRRYPRLPIQGGEAAILPVSLSVRILDISLSGVLVHSRQFARQGDRGRLRLALGGQPFTADIEVRRVSPGTGDSDYRIGVSFVGLNPELRQMIVRFTQQ